MKKQITLLTAAMILALTGCGNTGDDSSTQSTSAGAGTQVQTTDTEISDSGTEISAAPKNCNYDIEEAFTDENLAGMLEGDIKPVKMTYTMCGECLSSYDVTNKDRINEFIEALKGLTIKNVATDPEDFFRVCDGGNDFHFILENGSDVWVSLDLCAYADVGEVQYSFDNSEPLHNLCMELMNSGGDHDIEAIFTDEKLAGILDYETIPVKMVYTMHGECLMSYDVTDQDKICEFIGALGELKIKRLITDPEEMQYIFDGGHSFCFTLEDGSEVKVYFDLLSYATGDNEEVQFELENNEQLSALCARLKGTERYDIEDVFTDGDFADIMEGREMPVEIEYEMSSSEGVFGYAVMDSTEVEKFIDAFRELRISKVITDEAEKAHVEDAGNSFMFRLEDGREVTVSLDLFTYADVGDTQYVLENSESLKALCGGLLGNKE